MDAQPAGFPATRFNPILLAHEVKDVGVHGLRPDSRSGRRIRSKPARCSAAGLDRFWVSRRLRALNERTFRERYPQAPSDRGWSECPEPVADASLPQIFRALQDIVYNADLTADRDLALILSALLKRAVELLPEGANGSLFHEHDVPPVSHPAITRVRG